MSLSERMVIASEPSHVFHALSHPPSLAEWWGCTAVIDARPGGAWVGGWGEGEGGYGHQTVIWAELSRFQPQSALTLKMGDTEIHVDLAPDPGGTAVTVTQTGYPAASAEEERAALQSWVDMVSSLKVWVEAKHPYAPPRQSAPAPAPAPAAPAPAPRPATPPPQPAVKPQPVAQPQPAAPAPVAVPVSGMADPYGAAEAIAHGGIRVLDDGGFGVTDPNAVIKSWSKEQGFGYATHPQLGDVVFDYDGCDFEPAPGDKVLLLVIAKAWNGKPKVKRIACPAKGSKLDK